MVIKLSQNVIGGWGAYCNYGFESSYGTAVTGTRVFGHGTKLTISRKNNLEPIWELGNRNAQTTAAKKYEGTGTLDFNLSNASFFRAVLGEVADAGGGPYTHTYTETNVLPSFTILTGSELGTTDEVVALKGCIMNTCELTAAVNEIVKIRADFIFNNETLATSGIGSQVAETEDVFTFAQGTLEIPASTPIAYVQTITLTIDNSAELVWNLGSRFGLTPVAKQRKYDMKLSLVYSNPTTFLTKFFGAAGGPLDATPASQATLKLKFTNGLTGVDERTIEMNLTNIYFDTYDMTKDVNEILKEDMSAHAWACTNIIYTNNTAVDEGSP